MPKIDVPELLVNVGGTLPEEHDAGLKTRCCDDGIARRVVLDHYAKLLEDGRVVFVIVCKEGDILFTNFHFSDGPRRSNPQPPDFSIPIMELSTDAVMDEAVQTSGQSIVKADQKWLTRTMREIRRLWPARPALLGARPT